MKNHKSYFIGFVLFLIFLSSSIFSDDLNLDYKSADLELSILVKDSIKASDSILVNIVFENKSNKNIMLYNWKGGGSTISGCLNSFMVFTIIHDNLDTLNYTSIYPTPKLPYQGDTLILLPHQKYEEEIMLNSFYLPHYSIKSNLDNKTSNRKWVVGNYSIQCNYKYSHNPSWKYGRDLWQGDVKSNQLNIKVK